MCYGLERLGFEHKARDFFSSSQRPDRLWGPPSLLSSGHRGLFSRGVKVTIHLHLVPKSRMVELHLHFPTCLNGGGLNSRSPRITSRFSRVKAIIQATERGHRLNIQHTEDSEVEGSTHSGSCQIAVSGISGVEPSGSWLRINASVAAYCQYLCRACLL
jgi:hypothetical protein